MKLASFFVISTALHALAIGAYPVSLPTQIKTQFFPVTLWSLGEGVNTNPADAASIPKDNSSPKPAKAFATRRPLIQERSRNPAIRTETPKPRSEHRHLGTTDDEAVPSSNVAVVSALPSNLANDETEKVGRAGSHIGEKSGSGEGSRPSSGGMGRGLDEASGTGSGQLSLTQVQLRHTPPPSYPDTARENGKEGRVLLRVLVDEEGKSKIVEVTRSSGSSILDQAAAEAISRWLFSPARYGGMPTASWIKIPIDFRLTEANVEHSQGGPKSKN